jgi:hypothetical protein
MSILSTVTSVLEPIKNLGIPSEECKPTKCDDRGDEKHKGREESKNDDHEKQAKNDDHRDDREKQAKNDDHRDDHEKQVKNDDHRDDHDKQAKNDDHRDDHDKQAKNDDHRDDHDKQAKNDDHGNDHDKHAKNDDCQPHKDYCQPQKDHCDTRPADDCGKGNAYHSPGEALAKLDCSHSDLSSNAPDHSDMHGVLASMPSGHALDYAIGQMGSADHFDAGHFDIPADTSHHDIAHHA